MNILIVSQYFWPENFRINDLALGLKERGHEVTVFTGLPNYPEGKLFEGYSLKNGPFYQKWQDVQIFRSPLIPRGSKKSQLALNYASFAAAASLIGPKLIKGKFDAIFVYEISPVTIGLPAIALKKKLKAPIFFWVQDLWPETLVATGTTTNPRILKAIDKLVKYIYDKSDRVLVSSKSFIEDVRRLGQPENKIKYFPQWAEGLFEAGEVEMGEEAAQMPEGFKILYAGNIGVAQDIENILNAAKITAKIAPHIKWVILGDGRQKAEIEARVAAEGLHSHFIMLGRKPLESMPAWFSLADGLLVTLKKERIFAMTLPAKLQSYMAAGRPILAALDGEGAEVLAESGAGLVAPSGDAEALAEKAIELANKSELEREGMGRAGREYVKQHFDRTRLLEQLEFMIEEVKAGA